jgi:hypothetical protein
MELGTLAVLGLIGAVVLLPLWLEYGDLRRSSGLGRSAALGTTLFVLPALAVGIAAGLPLAAMPALQWTVAVAVTLLVYSLGVGLVRSTSEPDRVRARRG